MRQRAVVLPVLIAALALGVMSGNLTLTLALTGITLALALIGPRWGLDRGRQVVASLIGAGVAYTTVSLLFEQERAHLTEGWTRFSACILLAASARLIQLNPGGGAAGTVLLAFVAALAAGESRVRMSLALPLFGPNPYPVLVLLFLGVSLWALRVNDPQRPRLHRRSSAAALGVLTMAATLGTAGIIGLRQTHIWLTRRSAFSNSYAARQVQTGFSDQMELGALNGLLDSNSLVMRVRGPRADGPRVDYLRGGVFDLYEVGQWRRSDELKEVEDTWDETPPEGNPVEIFTLSASQERFFLPLNTRASALRPGTVKVDPFGVVKRSATGSDPLYARFSQGERDRAPLNPPSSHDRYLPPRIRNRLSPLVAEWTEQSSSPSEKLDAIERKLHTEYTYGRTFRRDRDVDPALDFLLFDHVGHCEYFATGMALLARTAKIPARVVTGYRVAERSPLDDYYLVRERNAHAWVEVWLDDRWVVRDPTPEQNLPQNQRHESSYFAAIIDLFRVRYDELAAWFNQRTTLQISAATAVGLLILGWLVARGAQGRRTRSAAVHPDELALPFLQDLLDALSRAGQPHDASEPLERFAARLPDPEAAALLRRYEALRYGDRDDAASLAAAMKAHSARLRAAPR